MFRRLPPWLPPEVRDIVLWADKADTAALTSDEVPGTTTEERRALAAIGGLAQALTTAQDRGGWPEVLAQWVRGSVPPEDDLVDRLRRILDTTPDPLALAYEQLVAGRNRRRLGTFFTPDAIVRHMITCSARLFDEPPTTVVDPGAGVGAFTIAAQRRWPATSVYAVDVNVVTLGLLAARTSVHGDTDRLILSHCDYLTWCQDNLPKLPGPTLVLGNPPYTRHQEMTAKQKNDARQASGDLITSGLAGLSAYFTAATLNALPREAGMALLLPATWTETRYGREIREHLWSSTRRRVELHMFDSETEVFPGTQVTAMVLLVGPSRNRSMPFKLRAAVLADDQVAITGRTDHEERKTVPPVQWKRPSHTRAKISETTGTIRLGEIARVRRGVATGANDFFFITDQTRDRWELPPETLRAAVVKAGHVDGLHVNERTHQGMADRGHPRWLLDLNDASYREDPKVSKYVAHGTMQNLNLRYLTGVREFWYVVEQVTSPDVLLAPIGKGIHRVLVNDIHAIHSNSLYGLYLADDAPYTAAALAAWLRGIEGQAALAEVARQYSGGSLKIEPRALRDVRLPGTAEMFIPQVGG